MQNAVIVAARRTAIGKFGGALAPVRASDLGAAVVSALLADTKIDPASVDEVVLGQVLTAGCGQNPARQASIAAGIPESVPAVTVGKVCGSGLKAAIFAAQAVRCGDAEIVIAGGQENMSAAPHSLPQSRDGMRMGEWALRDTMLFDGLWDIFNQYPMDITAENIASKYQIARQEQDEFALASQQKTEAAQNAGRFVEEIVPIEIKAKKGTPLRFEVDEFPRHGTTLESLTQLKPAFAKDGSVTAGNASGINDGAAAFVVMSEKKANALNLKPLARIAAYASAGVDPKIMGMGPVPASRACLTRAGWSAADLDLAEVNEAFAAQAIALNREMGWNTENINVNGGAIAIGHPIGASGARILVTLLHEMTKRSAKRGLASLCIGGGMGVALAVER